MDVERNIFAILRHHNAAQGVVVIQKQEDRIFVLDTEGRILETAVAAKWSRSSGDNHDLVPGPEADTNVISYREPSSPSLQVVVHKRFPVAPHFRKTMLELDIDFHSPKVNLIGHAAEVARNKLTGAKTDQREVAEALYANRGILVPTA